MKLLFISDIHGNHFALEAVLNHADAKQADEIYCCGDLCGYFTNVDEVVKLLKAHNVKTIMGNHDAFFLDQLVLNNQRSYFQSHIISRKKVGEQAYNYIANLPLTLSFKYNELEFALYHGGKSDLLSGRVFPGQIDVAQYATDVQVFGHTHLQFAVKTGGRLFLNPGAIGLPRNGDFRAHYLVLDTETLEVKACSIVYDVNAMINHTLAQKDTDFKFLHNLNFGRSSTKPLKEQFEKKAVLEEVRKFHPEISIINTNFGLILANNNFESSSPVLYLAFYEDNCVEISSSPIVFKWQAGNKMDSFFANANEFLKRDGAGFYYFKSFNNLERFVQIVAAEVTVAFELITKYKIQNVKI